MSGKDTLTMKDDPCLLDEVGTCSCCHHDHEHGHNHHHTENVYWYKNSELWEIFIGTAVFIAAQLLSFYESPLQLPLLIVAYIILGKDVLMSAAKNILKGHMFDENFLMGIATLGAFGIAEYPEAVGVMLFYRIGEYFEEKAANKSRKQIIDAVDMRPENVLLVTEKNETSSIPANEAAVGNIIMVRPGDRIPLDGSVIEGNSQIDTSPLTGESMPVTVAKGKDVLSGCINKTGVLKIRVQKVLSESMVSRILASVQNASANKPQIERFISRFARVYTPFVVISAAIIALVPSIITGQWHHYIYLALTFLVISCPCALVLSVPLAFFSGIGTASKQGILFKDGAAIEALSQVKTAALDKTGTITEGIFAVQEINSESNFDKDLLIKFCASAETASTHPLAVSIVNYAKGKNIALLNADQIEEISGKGIKAIIDEHEILCGNVTFLKENNIQIKNISNKTVIYLAIDGQYAGNIILGDKIKSDAYSAIKRLKKQGISVEMLTGDSQKGAEAVAREVNIDTVYAKLLPEEKLSTLRKIRSEKGKVMFVGDGINDAPVLANADVGAAMGSGADAAIEAADVVFMSSTVKSISSAVSIALGTRSIAIQNVVFALGVKGLIMLLGLIGYASLWSAVFADSGVALICVINSMRLLYSKQIA